MKLKLILATLGGIALSVIPTSAAIVVVDFGKTDSLDSSYNEFTTLASMSSAVALTTTTGASSGVSISFAGTVSQYTNYPGVDQAMNRGTAAATAWSSLTGGKNVADVASQGLGFTTNTAGTAIGVYTLSGLTVGQDYSLMVLSGVGSAGNASPYLTFVGVDSGSTYTGYDNSVGKTATYTAGTKTLNFASYGASGVSEVMELNFKAAATTLDIKMGGGIYYESLQGLAISSPAIIPEPSSAALLSGLGALALLRRRRK